MGGFAELDRADYSRVAALLATLAPLHGSIPAVLEGTAEGRIRVDDPDVPRVVLLDGPEGLYLGGSPRPDLDWAALRSAIHPLAYLYPAEAWLPVIDDALPHPFFLLHRRVTLSLDLMTVASSWPQSERFEIRPVTDEVSAEIVDGDKVVAHCHEDMVVGARVEVGIWTDPRYRRQGLARLAVAAVIEMARSRGLRRMGWHCLASNKGSQAVAMKSGFAVAAEYEAYGACLTAENSGDLDVAQWIGEAEHFGRAAAELPILGIYAAEAWASAGRSDEALVALERLAEGEWTGKTEWLEQGPLLEPVRSDPRFARVVERLREKESVRPRSA